MGLHYKHVKEGMMVRRGPDWEWGFQDKKGIGHVCSIKDRDRNTIDSDGNVWIYVEWKGGSANMYRVGPDKFDLEVASKTDIKIKIPKRKEK